MAFSLSLSRAALPWIRRQLGPALLAVAIAFGLSVVSEVRAATYPVSQGYWSDGSGSVSYDPAIVCQKVVDAAKASNAGRDIYTFDNKILDLNSTTKDCNLIRISNGTRQPSYINLIKNGTCAPGDTLSGSTCTAPNPPPTCPSAGQQSNASYFTVESASKLPYSIDLCIPMSGTSGGCGFQASARVGGLDKTTGKWTYQYMGPLVTTGKTCSGDNGAGTQPPVQDSPRTCDAGMCTGTVNGVQVCVRCAQTDTATAKNQTTTNPDGSTTQTTTSTSVTFNDNSVTTNTTTTTTSTPAGGGTPTTTTKTDGTSESKDSYCQRNPNDPQCKSLSQASGGADCTAPPVCNGDAIQCAMLSQQWQMRCVFDKQSPQSDLGNQVVAGNDPDASKHPALDANRTTIDMSGKIDSTPFLIGGALQDQTMPLNGQAVTLPFSKLNQYLTMLGNVFVAIALIGAAKIVTGGA